jgi:hypothetical protein
MNLAALVALQVDRVAFLTAETTWRLSMNPRTDGQAWHNATGLRVIWSIAVEQDRRPWLHVSASRSHEVPGYYDMVEVHRHFVGPDRYGYEVRAPATRHVNLNPYVLHMFTVLDDGPEPLPDFTRGGLTL